jgi:hypothetical protein
VKRKNRSESPSTAGSSSSSTAPDHLRWRPARLPRAGRRPRPDRDGRIHSRRGRRGKNIRHRLLGLCGRRSTAASPATRTSTTPRGSRATRPCAPSWAERADRLAASTSEMGRFETEWLATEANLAGAHGPVRQPGSTGCTAPAAGRHHPRHGQLGEPDPRRAGGLGLERPLPLQLLPPAVRVQPVRRPRAVRLAALATCTAPRLARGARSR